MFISGGTVEDRDDFRNNLDDDDDDYDDPIAISSFRNMRKAGKAG